MAGAARCAGSISSLQDRRKRRYRLGSASSRRGAQQKNRASHPRCAAHPSAARPQRAPRVPLQRSAGPNSTTVRGSAARAPLEPPRWPWSGSAREPYPTAPAAPAAVASARNGRLPRARVLAGEARSRAGPVQACAIARVVVIGSAWPNRAGAHAKKNRASRPGPRSAERASEAALCSLRSCREAQ